MKPAAITCGVKCRSSEQLRNRHAEGATSARIEISVTRGDDVVRSNGARNARAMCPMTSQDTDYSGGQLTADRTVFPKERALVTIVCGRVDV